MEWYSIKLYRYDHFGKYWEDRKNGLYMIELNADVDKWLCENIKHHYEINCDDFYNSRSSSKHKNVNYIFIDFTDREEAMGFKLRWK